MPKTPPAHIVIATRQSRLALWQAEHVRQQLLAFYPEAHVSLLGLTTTGDDHIDVWRVLHGQRDIPAWLRDDADANDPH